MGVLFSGILASANMADAQKPPEKDPDGDGLNEGIVFEIIGLLKHPVFGLELIKNAIDHIEAELHDSDYGLDAIDDEVEHIETEIHDSDYGLDAIDDEVEYNTALLEHPEFGLEEIKREVRFIENNVTSPVFGLEKIHDHIHDLDDELNLEHDDREVEHESIQTVVDSLGETGIKPFKVQIDMRFNQYDGIDLVVADALANRFGVIAHCPNEDPNCGQFTFSSVKNLNGFNYIYPNVNGNSHEESKSVCGPAGCATDVNVGFLNSPRTLTHFDLDDSGNIITSDLSIFDIPIPVLIGTEANVLMTAGLGTQYGQKMVFTTNPIPYTGVMEFLIYAPEGSTFTHIWGCDNLGLDPHKPLDPSEIAELAAGDPGLALATYSGISTAETQHNCDWESGSPMSVEEYSPTKNPS